VGVRTAIEVHDSEQSVYNNTIENFHTGVIYAQENDKPGPQNTDIIEQDPQRLFRGNRLDQHGRCGGPGDFGQ
jgi:hypothetical protein